MCSAGDSQISAIRAGNYICALGLCPVLRTFLVRNLLCITGKACYPLCVRRHGRKGIL